jgi:hypothetical protein
MKERIKKETNKQTNKKGKKESQSPHPTILRLSVSNGLQKLEFSIQDLILSSKLKPVITQTDFVFSLSSGDSSGIRTLDFKFMSQMFYHSPVLICHS